MCTQVLYLCIYHRFVLDGTYLLGDSAYPCRSTLIVPYRDNGHLTAAQRNFNKRLSKCRVVVENAFGLLKQRFRQLYHCKLKSLSRTVKLIYVACVLHNLADLEDISHLEPPQVERPDPQAQQIVVLDDQFMQEEDIPGNILRDEICRQLVTN